MTKAQDFDKDIFEECRRIYGDMNIGELRKAQKKLLREKNLAKASLDKSSEARAALSPHESRACLTRANARHYTAAEHFERTFKKLAYVDALLEPQSHHALFDGSDADLLDEDDALEGVKE